ncbi:MAG: hypothetical protein ACHQC8_02385 [Solirubrobacterales bacterium]
MTTDVHQQRLNKARQGDRICDGCGVALYEFESAWPTGDLGHFKRVDRCLHCCIYGPPRRPVGSPPLTRTAAGTSSS